MTIAKGISRLAFLGIMAFVVSALLVFLSPTASYANNEVDFDLETGATDNHLPERQAPGKVSNPPPASGGNTTGTENECRGWSRHPSEPNWIVQNCTNTYDFIDFFDAADPVFPAWVGENPISGYRYVCSEREGSVLLGYSGRYTQAVYRTFDEESGSILWDHTTIGNPQLSGDCVYRQYQDRVETEFCYVGAEISVSMTTPSTRNYGASSAVTPWGQGNHTLDACEASKSVGVSLSRTLSDLGRYAGYPIITRDRITVRHYADVPGTATPEPEIVRIDSASPMVGPTLYAQVACDPNYSSAGYNRSQVYRGSWSWTWSDCLAEDGSIGDGEYRCVGNGAPSINGGSPRSSATLFRDDEPNTIEWNNPRLQSPSLVRVNSTQTRMTRSGTPWNTPNNMPVSNNNVTLHTDGGRNVLAGGNSWMNGKQDSYVFRANWASDAGAPTVLNPRWRFDATWRVQGIRLEHLVIPGGQVTYSPYWTTTDATADCTGRVSLDIVRAVNDRGSE